MKLAAPRGIALRLALAFGALVALLLLVAALGLTRLDALNREFSTIVVDRVSRIGLLKDVSDAQQTIMRLVNHALVIEGQAAVESDLGRIEAAKRTIGERLEQLDKAFDAEDARGKALLSEAHQRNSAYLVNLIRFTRLVAAGKSAEARVLLATSLEGQMDAAHGALATLGNAQTALMHRAQQEAQASYENERLRIAGVSAAAVIVSIVVAFVIARGITRPLARAVELARCVAAGNLSARGELRGDDETARLMHALNRMVESLTVIVESVRAGSGVIAGTARELVAGNSQLTERAEEQASSLEQTAASLEEITATVQSNANHAGEANRLALETSEIAARGGATLARAVERMASVTNASRRIAEITDVINGLATQTNLLSLNAAVEAARAGEQGRGFGVVAAEVRALAHRSATAAREIGQLLADTLREVEDGASLVNEAGATMGGVVSGIRDVSSLIRDISNASQEQSEAIVQVNQALALIDQVTQHNVALAEETAAAVESLEQQARVLVESVGVFQLAKAPAAHPAGEPRLPDQAPARGPASRLPAVPPRSAKAVVPRVARAIGA